MLRYCQYAIVAQTVTIIAFTAASIAGNAEKRDLAGQPDADLAPFDDLTAGSSTPAASIPLLDSQQACRRQAIKTITATLLGPEEAFAAGYPGHRPGHQYNSHREIRGGTKLTDGLVNPAHGCPDRGSKE